MSSENTSIEESNQQGLAVSSTKSLSTRTIALASRGLQDLRTTEQAEGWLTKGVESYRQQRYEDAFRCFERGIQLNPNHPEIQFMLGLSFDEGRGTGASRDNALARAWYRKAAEQGLKEAQYNLGLLYEGWNDGPGLHQNYEQAAIWFRRAADQGYERAQRSLGLLLALGLVVPRDHAEIRGAAEQGNAKAQFSLGIQYQKGEGVLQDYAQAAVWFRKAADQGYADAQNNLGWMYDYGQGVPQDYAQAAIWYRRAGEQGVASAQYYLGVLYDHGVGVTQDNAQAAVWLSKAAAQGHREAQKILDERHILPGLVPRKASI